jgi:hypothetical protein
MLGLVGEIVTSKRREATFANKSLEIRKAVLNVSLVSLFRYAYLGRPHPRDTSRSNHGRYSNAKSSCNISFEGQTPLSQCSLAIDRRNTGLHFLENFTE